jgi:hypothetical protein
LRCNIIDTHDIGYKGYSFLDYGYMP